MSKTQKNQHAFIFIFLFSIIAVLLSLFALWISIQAFQESGNSATDRKQSYEIESIRFCYNNKLPNCSPEAINAWNNQNPDNTFSPVDR